MDYILLSFGTTMLLFVIVGLLSMRKSKHTSQDYLTASRSVPPWLAGLSAVATNNSGYMFVGMIGYTYTVGLPSIWLMIGWIVGDFIASINVHKALIMKSQEVHAHSVGGLIANWQGKDYFVLRKAIGVLIVLFLIVYTAAQLGAGSKALTTIMGWDRNIGTILAALIILFYSFSGGLRASIWTDALQSFIMIISMFMLLFVSIDSIGGYSVFMEKIFMIKPGYMDWFPSEMKNNYISIFGFVIGWFFGGIGVVGQPHILIRYMALDSVNSLNRMRAYYYIWFTLFYAATICVGLISHIAIPEVQNFDPETALLVLSQQTLTPIFIGIMLAGLFAATISTADSLVLSCSASLTRDFTLIPIENYKSVKIGTLFVTISALLIATLNNKTIFALVLDAWGVFASTLGPIIFLLAKGHKISENKALILMFVGIVSFYGWNFFGTSTIYAIAPAWLIVFILYYILTLNIEKRH
ncbi:MAG: sodium/proline symporter [Sulfurovaceae bacterium]|nr:sodium/proline symporter [Sulfurovaceae bacterium]MDD5360363.1 sodium/proline symporter [Sulfurovaceae bacterium]MDD5548916.1 sodium/proline symporter [Sulfurovaceae bacterium]